MRDRFAALVAVGRAHARIEQPQIVVYFSGRGNRGTRTGAAAALLDGNRRREPLDILNIRLLHLLEELPGVCGETLDVAPLSLGEDGVEGQRRLARAGQSGDDYELVAGDVDVEAL